MVLGVNLNLVLVSYIRQIQQRSARDVKKIATLEVSRGNNLLAFKDFVIGNCESNGYR